VRFFADIASIDVVAALVTRDQGEPQTNGGQ
jgi:hypothetical protein